MRLWRTERTKDDILRYMRISGGDALLDQSQDMIAYWDFNEPDDDRQAALITPHSFLLSFKSISAWHHAEGIFPVSSSLLGC